MADEKKPELNKDGLIPGQSVDFETMVRVNTARKNQDVKQSKSEVVRDGRSSEQAKAD